MKSRDDLDLEVQEEIEVAELSKDATDIIEADAKTYVEVRKDGAQLLVHPTCVDAHVRAGWKRSE